MKKEMLSKQRISDICRELALLLRSGLSIENGLTLMYEENGDELFHEMAQQAQQRSSLYEIFQAGGRFPEDVCGMVQAGEQTGRLDQALDTLARYYERQVRMDHRIRSALLYPAILLMIMMVVIVVLLTRVLPVFNDVYANLGASLTGVAGGLLSLGQLLNRMMPLLCALMVCALLFLAAFSGLPAFRESLLRLWRRSFGDRGLSKQMNEAKFAQALALGMQSGLYDEDAVQLAGRLLADIPSAKERCERCVQLLREDGSLSQALEKTRLMPKRECRLLELGLRSGSGDSTIEHIASRLSQQSELSLEERVAKIEPALVVFTSILVGMILLSVMLPLMDIMAAIG